MPELSLAELRVCVEQGLSQSEIARRYATYPNAIRRLVIQHGLHKKVERLPRACRGCGRTDELATNSRTGGRTVYHRICRPCLNLVSNRYYADNRADVVERRRVRRKSQPARMIIEDSRRSDRKNG